MIYDIDFLPNVVNINLFSEADNKYMKVSYNT